MPVAAAGEPGEVEFNKTAVISGDREYTVTLTVDGNPLTSSGAADIVLVVDVSLSMNQSLTPTQSRLQVLKAAATSFVSAVLDGGNNRVAVVEYSTDVTGGSNWNDGRVVQAFSSNPTTVNGSINSLDGEAYTNTEAGFYHADVALDSARSGVDLYVFFMTDGLPNRYYSGTGSTQGSGSSFSVTAADQAIDAAQALISNHQGTKIFTVGLNTTPGDQANMEYVLNPASPDDYPEEYFYVTTADGLSDTYDYFSQLITQIATAAVVTDIIQDGFSYIAGSLSFSSGTSAVVTGSPATQEVVTWTIGTINDEVKTLTYRVRADDPVYGGAFTNESAEIVFEPAPENDFYTPDPDGTVTLDFPKPVVPVPPIAVDDSYTVNSGSSLPIPAPGVLINDISNDQRADGGWTSTPISGSVSVVPGSGPSNGILVQNPDGSFTYTPNPGFSGIDTYEYEIYTDVTPVLGGATTRLFDTAIVTITVIPSYVIRVHKTDAENGANLAGVIFELYNEAKTIVLETLPATDGAGYAQTTSTYSSGTYYLKESFVPAGYQLDPTFYPVVIGLGSGMITIDVQNERLDYPIGVYKVDANTGLPLAGVVFDLFSDPAGTNWLETLPATDSNGFAQTATNYAPATYYLKEKSSVEGYLFDNTVYPVIVQVGQPGGIATITVRNIPARTNIEVTKTWVDDNNAQGTRPGSITVRLLRKIASDPNAAEVASHVIAGPPWNYTFSNLPLNDGLGNLFIYSISEDAVPSYNTDIDGYAITNTLTDTVDIRVAKTWQDDNNAEGLRPASITVKLWRKIASDPNAVEVASHVIAGPPWNYTFTSLPKYDALGRLYFYSISEDAVPSYSTDIDGYTITNTLTGTVDIPVTKTWVDSGNAYLTRPASITVHLWRAIADVPSLAEIDQHDLVPEAWAYTFMGLPKYDSIGRKFIYSITEDPVTNYATVINGFDITNTLDTVDVTVHKMWTDDDNAALLRPASVELQLYRNGSAFLAPVQINGTPDWNYTFNDLPAKDGNSDPYTYTVLENTVIPGYETTYDQQTLTVTNTLITHPIQIIKLDQRDGTTPLAGAIFELHQAVWVNDPDPVVGPLLETLTTDANGMASTSGLNAPGKYFLVETQAPAGFHLITTPILINVAIDGYGADGIFKVIILNNFINLPDISIDKTVANNNQGDPYSDLAELMVGETARYKVVVTNTGNAVLNNVTLTDDEAVVGGTIYNATANTDHVWVAGVGGIATLNLGTLLPGASIVLIYDYMTVAGDLAREPITNTATVTGFMDPTPDYPQGTTVDADDTAMISVQALPLAGLAITKLVQNETAGGVPADLAVGYVGHVFLYTVTISNNGSQKLANVTLTDDRAVVGSAVRNVTTATDFVWASGVGGIATIMVGELNIGQSMTFTYRYTGKVADVDQVLLNMAVLKGTTTVYVEAPTVITVQDPASIIVEQIPITGETQSTSGLLAGLAMLFGAAALVLFRRRKEKHHNASATENI